MSGYPTPLPCYRDALEKLRTFERIAVRFTQRSGRVPSGLARAATIALAAGINEGLSGEQIVRDTGRIAETHGALAAARRSR